MQPINHPLLNSNGTLNHDRADRAARDARSAALRALFPKIRDVLGSLARPGARGYHVIHAD